MKEKKSRVLKHTATDHSQNRPESKREKEINLEPGEDFEQRKKRMLEKAAELGCVEATAVMIAMVEATDPILDINQLLIGIPYKEFKRIKELPQADFIKERAAWDKKIQPVYEAFEPDPNYPSDWLRALEIFYDACTLEDETLGPFYELNPQVPAKNYYTHQKSFKDWCQKHYVSSHILEDVARVISRDFDIRSEEEVTQFTELLYATTPEQLDQVLAAGFMDSDYLFFEHKGAYIPLSEAREVFGVDSKRPQQRAHETTKIRGISTSADSPPPATLIIRRSYIPKELRSERDKFIKFKGFGTHTFRPSSVHVLVNPSDIVHKGSTLVFDEQKGVFVSETRDHFGVHGPLVESGMEEVSPSSAHDLFAHELSACTLDGHPKTPLLKELATLPVIEANRRCIEEEIKPLARQYGLEFENVFSLARWYKRKLREQGIVSLAQLMEHVADLQLTITDVFPKLSPKVQQEEVLPVAEQPGLAIDVPAITEEKINRREYTVKDIDELTAYLIHAVSGRGKVKNRSIEHQIRHQLNISHSKLPTDPSAAFEALQKGLAILEAFREQTKQYEELRTRLSDQIAVYRDLDKKRPLAGEFLLHYKKILTMRTFAFGKRIYPSPQLLSDITLMIDRGVALLDRRLKGLPVKNFRLPVSAKALPDTRSEEVPSSSSAQVMSAEKLNEGVTQENRNALADLNILELKVQRSLSLIDSEVNPYQTRNLDQRMRELLHSARGLRGQDIGAAMRLLDEAMELYHASIRRFQYYSRVKERMVTTLTRLRTERTRKNEKRAAAIQQFHKAYVAAFNSKSPPTGEQLVECEKKTAALEGLLSE